MSEAISKTRSDEAFAALAVLPRGNLLLPYQQAASRLVLEHALLVIEKSRRIGLTWGLASHAVLTAAAQRGEGGQDALYISYSQEMTREFIDACAMWARAFVLGAAEAGEFLFDDQQPDGTTRQIKAFRISFASGFEIIALSSAPRSLRGKQGLVIIDEAAFVDQLAELLKAALALLMWGGRVVVVSTHNGVDNPFNGLIDEVRSGRRAGHVQTITFADALAQGLYERVCLVKGVAPTAEGRAAWEAEIRAFYGDDAAEELDCVPSTGSGAWLDAGALAACMTEEAGDPALYRGGITYVGRDVSRRRDLSVIHAYEQVGRALVLRERWLGHKATFAEQATVFARVLKQYRVLRALIDQTGMGEAVVEQAITDHGSRVGGVLFTGPNRLDMAIALKQRVDEGTIRLPNDPALRRDLMAIKKARQKGDGPPRLVNEGEVHADEFWAAALACLAANETLVAMEGYEAAPRAPRSPLDGARRGQPDRMTMRPGGDDAPGRKGRALW